MHHIDKTSEVREMNARLARIEQEMDEVIEHTDAMLAAIDEQCEAGEVEEESAYHDRN